MATATETIRKGTVGIWSSSRQWPVDPAGVASAAAALDELGYSALWIGSLAGSFDLPEAILATTQRLVVATGVLDVWTTPAATMAAEHHRLQEAYAGRFVLGLGPSHAPLVERSGQRYVRPLGRVREFLDELDAATPPVPVDERVIAALGPRALTLAAERTAGAHPYLVTPEHTARAREVLGPGPLLAPEQKVVLATDPTVARDVGRQRLAPYLDLPNYVENLRRLGFDDGDFAAGGSDHLVDSLVAWGDLDAIRRRIDDHLAAGADHVALQVLPTTGALASPVDAWRQAAPLLG